MKHYAYVTTALLLSSLLTTGVQADFFGDHQQGPLSNPAVEALRRSPALDELTAAVVPTFTQQTYRDSVTGLTVTYNLYLPKGYDQSQTYPLVVFIGDASTVGTDATRPLTQSGYGGVIWASPDVQKDHPSIVVAPQYPKVILDDHGDHVLTDYVELTARLIQHVEQTYAVDRRHVYGTGQSMGCMTTMYLAANHPDLFTATLLVDGQWDKTALAGLKSQRFIYVAAGGDDKALGGLRDVEGMMQDAGIPYGTLENMDARENAYVRNAAAAVVLDQGYAKNFFVWKAGSVLPEGAPQEASEHMFSFNYAYEMKAFRDWLFAQ